MKWISRTFSYSNEDILDQCVEKFLNSPEMANALNIEKQFQTVFAGEDYQVFYVLNIIAQIWETGEWETGEPA